MRLSVPSFLIDSNQVHLWPSPNCALHVRSEGAQSFWLADYFPEVWQAVFDAFPPLSEVAKLIEEVTARMVRIEEFSLPHDLADQFAAAGWRRPEIYLNAEVRAGMSAFRLADQTLLAQQLTRLGEDLQSGEWQRNYGWVKELEEYDAGYRFVCATGVMTR